MRAGDGDPLPLPAGKFYAAFADQGLIPGGEFRDELVGIGRVCAACSISACAGVPPAVGDVLGDRAVEEERVLLDDAEQAAIAIDRDVADVTPSSTIAPLVGSKNRATRLHSVVLPAPRRPDQRDDLPRRHIQIDVA